MMMDGLIPRDRPAALIPIGRLKPSRRRSLSDLLLHDGSWANVTRSTDWWHPKEPLHAHLITWLRSPRIQHFPKDDQMMALL
jgi:hypothetical protein